DTQGAKSPVLQHSGETTMTISDRKCFSFVVPVHRNHGIGFAFIVIIVAFVFIQDKITIRPPIDTQINGICFGRSPLHGRAKSDNGAGLGINRDPVQGSLCGDDLTTLQAFPRPEVYPIAASREIERPLRCSFGSYGIDQQRGTEHKLVRNSSRLRIGGKLKGKSSHERFPALGDAPSGGIDVRQQTISQLIVLPEDLFDLWTVIPELSV